MGLSDAILGTSTTANQAAATNQANGLIAQNQASNDDILRNSYGNANTALNTGATNATGLLSSNFGNANTALTGYDTQAQNALLNGVANAVNTAQSSNANYQPYAANGGQANGLLSNALGLNGAAGNAAAQSAFTGSPGYQYTVDQATQQAQRAAAAGGMLASGNTLRAVSQLGSNLANQNYQQYINNLSGLSSQGLTAASGVSANNQAAAGYQNTGGANAASLYQQTGSGLGALDQALGNNSANIQTGLGTSLANDQTGYAGALTGNNNAATSAIAGNDLGLGRAEDTAANTNSGLLSNALKNTASGLLGGGGGLLSSFLGYNPNSAQDAAQNAGYL